jgi:energy-coupling factor transporter ATP-binding protein EcfA2
MRATGLKLERFKIVGSVELRLAPLTLLIGGNNAGKSTVLQALALLAQSVGGREFKTDGPYVDLGGTPTALLNRSSRIGEGWSIEVTWRDPADERVEIHFLCRWGVDDPPVASEGRVHFDLAGGVTVRAWGSSVGPRLEVDGLGISTALDASQLRSEQRFGNLPTPAAVSAAESRLTDAVLADPDALANYARSVAAPYFYDELAPRPGIARALSAYRYVGPDRHFTHAAYELSDTVPVVPLNQGDLANALAYDRDVRRAVDQRCREIFGFGVSADFAQGRNVDLVATSEDGKTYSLNHMGSGFGQVVWIAVYLELQRRMAASGLVPFVGIEEAELHLHPAAQPRVARMLVAYARAGVQQILTTQSEHLLIALLQLVTTGELNAAELAVYHVDSGAAERLEVDERGRLSGGLKGFFEANEEELLAHLEALTRGEDQS